MRRAPADRCREAVSSLILDAGEVDRRRAVELGHRWSQEDAGTDRVADQPGGEAQDEVDRLRDGDRRHQQRPELRRDDLANRVAHRSPASPDHERGEHRDRGRREQGHDWPRPTGACDQPARDQQLSGGAGPPRARPRSRPGGA